MPFSHPAQLQPTFAAALQAEDLDALVDLYEPDAVVAMPDGTELVGAVARRDMLASLLAAGTAMRGTRRKVLVAGDLALTSTSYEVSAPEPGARAIVIETAEVSRLQPDGTWRVVIDAPTFT